MKLDAIMKPFEKSVSKNSPYILLGLGIIGMVSATVAAVRATPKVLEILEQAEDAKDEPLTIAEKVQFTWKEYLPPVIVGGISIACLIGSSSIHAKRNSALAAAYALTTASFKDYRSKAKELLGEKKETEIRDAISQDALSRVPHAGNKEVIITNKDDTLCFDKLSGRYLRSNMAKLKEVENRINRRMLDDMFISLNDYYYEIGLPPIDLGSRMGWNIRDGLLDLHYSSNLTDDGEPCLVIDYYLSPKEGFENHW